MRKLLLLTLSGLLLVPALMLWGQYTAKEEKLPGDPIEQPTPTKCTSVWG